MSVQPVLLAGGLGLCVAEACCAQQQLGTVAVVELSSWPRVALHDDRILADH